MPELPEVETVVRSLTGRVVGQRIRAVRIHDFPGVLGSDSVESVNARVAGHVVRAVRRRAKYVIIELDDDTALVAHLRMTGRLSAVSRDEPPLRHERLTIEFDGDRDLRFSDQRKFGRVVHLHHDDLDALDQRLGREPLSAEFTPAWLAQRLARRPGKIKAVLLDQGLIAGLGNIYVDEALFLAGVHPERAANGLAAEEVGALHDAVQEVLRAAVDGRGTTFRSFEDAEGNQGRYGARLRVYGRGGKGGCPRCGTPLQRLVVGGRGTSFCPRCQPAAAAEPDQPAETT